MSENPAPLVVRAAPFGLAGGFVAEVYDRAARRVVAACTHQHGRNLGPVAGRELALECGDRLRRRELRRRLVNPIPPRKGCA